MKFYKILSTALLFPALMAISSCEEATFDVPDYTPAESVTGTQVYFEGAVNTNFTVSAVDTVFTIKLSRVQKDSVATIALKAEADSATLTKFSFPSVATFAAGEATTTISCVAKVDSMEYDTPYTVKLCIANEEDATLYGQSFVTLKVTCPAPWKSLGMGKIADFFYSDKYFKVEIQRNELQPSKFRVVSPYDQIMEDAELTPNEGPSPYFEFEIVPAGSSLGNRTFPEEFVYFPPTRTGHYYDDGEYSGEVYAYHTAHFNSNLCSDEEVCFYNKVVAYQEVNGEVIPAQVFLAPLYYIPKDGVNFDKSTTKTEGMIDIIFPGYVPSDYSVDLSYSGIFTKPDGSIFAVGSLALGADATEVKAIVMPMDADAAALADAIAAGELEATDVEAGRIEVPFNAEELGGNNFQIIVVVLADGAVKSVAAASFEYYGGVNPWESLGTGIYTDDVLVPLFYKGGTPVSYEVEILEHTEKPGLYRIMNPYAKSVHPLGDDTYAPEGMYIEVNATDAEGVYIQPQSLGMDWGYGEMQLVTEGARYLASNPFEAVKGAGLLGKVVEGVITFPTFTQSNGITYQGILYMGESGSPAGMNGKMEITLPGANAFARNMAIAKANTTKREMAKKSFSGVKVTTKMKKLFNLTANSMDTPNF